MAAVGTIRTYHPDPGPADELQHVWQGHFRCAPNVSDPGGGCRHGRDRCVNGRELGRYVERHTRISKQFVLDLRAVDFFGGQAFTALYYISVYCARSDVDWIIVGSPPVRRLLAICDPESELPLADDLPSGLARLDRLTQRHHSITSAV